MELDRDGFAAEQAVAIAPELNRLEFVLENRSDVPHTALVKIEGLAPGTYRAVVANQRHDPLTVTAGKSAQFALVVNAAQTHVLIEPFRDIPEAGPLMRNHSFQPHNVREGQLRRTHSLSSR
jgi:hypothetical protein